MFSNYFRKSNENFIENARVFNKISRFLTFLP